MHTGEYGLTPLTVVVPRELEQTPWNASLLLLSGDATCIIRSCGLLTLRSAVLGTEIIDTVYRHYGEEGIRMPFSLEQFRKEVRREFLDTCTVEERLQGLAVEGRFRGLAVEDLQKLPAQLNQQLLELLQAANARSGTP